MIPEASIVELAQAVCTAARAIEVPQKTANSLCFGDILPLPLSARFLPFCWGKQLEFQVKPGQRALLPLLDLVGPAEATVLPGQLTPEANCELQVEPNGGTLPIVERSLVQKYAKKTKTIENDMDFHVIFRLETLQPSPPQVQEVATSSSFWPNGTWRLVRSSAATLAKQLMSCCWSMAWRPAGAWCELVGHDQNRSTRLKFLFFSKLPILEYGHVTNDCGLFCFMVFPSSRCLCCGHIIVAFLSGQMTSPSMWAWRRMWRSHGSCRLYAAWPWNFPTEKPTAVSAGAWNLWPFFFGCRFYLCKQAQWFVKNQSYSLPMFHPSLKHTSTSTFGKKDVQLKKSHFDTFCSQKYFCQRNA